MLPSTLTAACGLSLLVFLVSFRAGERRHHRDEEQRALARLLSSLSALAAWVLAFIALWPPLEPVVISAAIAVFALLVSVLLFVYHTGTESHHFQPSIGGAASGTQLSVMYGDEAAVTSARQGGLGLSHNAGGKLSAGPLGPCGSEHLASRLAVTRGKALCDYGVEYQVTTHWPENRSGQPG